MRKIKKFSSKKQSDLKNKNSELATLFFFLGFVLSVYIFIVPYKSGILGKAFFTVIFGTFGTASYILPLIFLQRFVIMCDRDHNKFKKKYYFIWSLICFISCSILFESMRFIFAFKIHGGWIGNNLYPFFKDFLDVWPSFVVVLIVSAFFFINFLRIFINFLGRNFFISPKNVTSSKEKKSKNIICGDKNKIQKNIIENTKHELVKPNIISKQDKQEKKKKIAQPIIVNQEKIPCKNFNYTLPYTDLLKNDFNENFETNKAELLAKAELLRITLSDFGINAKVKDIIPGPLVTRYDLILSPGVRIQAVSNIIDNISLAMRSASIRVVNIPEKAVVGIEVPNSSNLVVGLRGILEESAFKNSKSLLTLALGKTTEGLGYIVNLTSMPHLLIAGATGSGKSIGVHTIILSILYKARPDEVKFVLIDPKHVEMSVYKDIPHIYNPCVRAIEADIITNSKEASEVLKKLVLVMNERYAKFAKNGVRNIEDYNNKMFEIFEKKEFYIVVIIDELADLMLLVQKEIEDSIQRLSQMARAVGIHLILATQRPSVNVITGVIKANLPARLSFQMTSKVDSRVILDMIGAERLMGKGDMLFLPPGESRPVRLQGAYVSLNETEKIVSFVKEQNFPRMYEPMVVEVVGKESFNANELKWGKDLISALKLIKKRKRVSQDLLKANFGSSARATNLLSILETEGFIAKPEGTNKWQIDYGRIEEYLEDNRKLEKYSE
ncbi:MAG: DNA translocase FtsK [Endomicrobium sp.]|jgi:S-DNA-T family DNA segregation ATPase FtsK/SpoIIIE|nr:DNA translocase FtsK [Endomicrobium sp.]